MAEEDTPKRADEDEEPPQIAVPSHDPLPLPPDVPFTRPTLGAATPSPQKRLGSSGSAGGSSQGNTPSSFNLGTGMSAGITLASSVVVGFLIGQWIDHHWHLALPWGTIIFSLAGVAAGFINLFRILNASDDQRK